MFTSKIFLRISDYLKKLATDDTNRNDEDEDEEEPEEPEEKEIAVKH